MIPRVSNFIIYTLGYFYNRFKTKNFFSKNSHENRNIIDEIKDKGFIKIEKFVDDNACEEMKDGISQFINSNSSLVSVDDVESDFRIFGSEHINKKINDHFNNNFIRNICQRYLGCEIDCLMTMANRVIFKENNAGSGGGWHKDSPYRQFKSILYLSDVNEMNGPFELIKNSNKFWWNITHINFLKKKVLETRFSNQEIDILMKKKNVKKITLLGKKGTLLLLDTSLIHRGSPLRMSERYALTNYLYPSRQVPMYENHFQPRLKNDLHFNKSNS